MEMAEELSKRPPLAVTWVLKAMMVGSERGALEGLKTELEGIRVTSQSQDAIEGFTAFMQKRKPVFKGK